MDTQRNRAGADRAADSKSTNFPCVARTGNKGSNRKAVIDIWSPPICKVSTLLFALIYINSIIFAIIQIISQDKNAIWAVFIAEMSPSGRSGISILPLVVRHDPRALSY